jgi:DNA-binding MarR family transcriptional regulator
LGNLGYLSMAQKDPPIPIAPAPRPEWLAGRNEGTHPALEFTLALGIAARRVYALAPADVPPLHLQILMALRRHRSLAVSELAALLHVKDKSVSRALHKLHEQRLVREVGDHDDGRRRQQRLTDAGQRTISAFFKVVREENLDRI